MPSGTLEFLPSNELHVGIQRIPLKRFEKTPAASVRPSVQTLMNNASYILSAAQYRFRESTTIRARSTHRPVSSPDGSGHGREYKMPYLLGPSQPAIIRRANARRPAVSPVHARAYAFT